MKVPNLFKHVVKHAAKSDSRPVLKGVHIDGGTLTATDVFRLLSFTVPNVNDHLKAPVIVSASELGKVSCRKGKDVSISVDGDTVKASTESGDAFPVSTSLSTIKGDYPDWKKVLSTRDPLFSFKVNGHYLKEMADAMKDMNSLHEVTVEFYGAGSPVVFKAKGHTTGAMLGVIMPLRS